jgi:hypothetical protein
MYVKRSPDAEAVRFSLALNIQRGEGKGYCTSSLSECGSLSTTKPCVPTAIPGKTKANCRNKGKNKRQIASLPAPTCPQRQAGKPAYPFTPNGVYLFFILWKALWMPKLMASQEKKNGQGRQKSIGGNLGGKGGGGVNAPHRCQNQC